ncbi:amidohydrolase family protein [Streptomyces sp. NPDC002133]|uniref:amidohydrolase family protein n=1 Tax=Streptomyces sp. NPDC002133 TaxID=3154409 RepID=UPI003317994C
MDQAPGRLLGLAAADLMRPQEAVRELRRAVRKLGFVGLRLVPWLWGLPAPDPAPPESVAPETTDRTA